MKEIYNDEFYKITIDGEIEELDNEDLMKIYMKASNPITGEETEVLVYDISFLEDIFSVIETLCEKINKDKEIK